MMGSMMRRGAITTGCAATSEPDVVTGLTATPSGSTTINLAWDADSTSAPNEVSEYEVWGSTNGSAPWKQIATVTAPTLSYSDTSLSAGTTRHYYIIARNCYDSANPSTSASATTAAGSIAPDWDIDFSTGSTYADLVLTRASTGTYVDSSGYIASASTDVARLTHNSSGSRLGLLVEEQRTNRAPSSVLLDGSWVNGGFMTRTTQTSIATPRGASVSASKFSGTSLSSTSAWYFTQTSLASGDYTFSVYAKADGADFLYLFVADGTNDHGRYFDLSNGTMGNTVGTLVSSSITDAGNGWYRCVITWNNPSSATRYPALLPSTTNATGRSSQAGTSPDGILVTAVQFEAASSVSSWIETTSGSAVTRSADLAHVLDSSITSWGDPGALVVHFYPPGQAGTLISTDDAATAQVGIEASTTTAARAFWSSGSTATGTIGSGVQKAVHYWNGSTSKFCINGGTVQTGTNNLTIGNTDFVTFGAEATESGGVPGTFSQYANCVIRKVEFYTGTLTDANLQTITT